MEIKIEIKNKGYEYTATASLTGGNGYLCNDVCEMLLKDLIGEVKKR